ncbi:MAG TPA: hypothetical protein VMD79_08315 [Solirubrobacteraceae bacterium]|nr:hypothetical protein [Solirubrobacteraceae bacterium]
MLSLLALACMAPTPAAAWSGHGTEYTLEVGEGETTLPEFVSVAGTTAKDSQGGQVAVAIIRNGTTVYKSEGNEGYANVPQVPQPGETVVLESPVGHVIGSDVYDGMPTIDPSTCVGATTFEGDNTSGFTVEGSYVTYTLLSAKHRRYNESNFSQAQVKTLTGTSFGGSFLTPIPSGATVTVKESLKTQLSGEATYTYISERTEPANKTCPTPPPPPPPPPLVTPLAGALVALGHTKIHLILKSGYRDHVRINQAGTITQDLYLRGGKLPAVAASAHKHHKIPPALLLARGTATSSGAGTVGIVLKLTPAGRRKLKASRRVSAILLTTLRTKSGQIATLAPKSLTFHR